MVTSIFAFNFLNEVVYPTDNYFIFFTFFRFFKSFLIESGNNPDMPVYWPKGWLNASTALGHKLMSSAQRWADHRCCGGNPRSSRSHTILWILKNHYVTFNHCTSLPHIIFCIIFLYVFKYFILLLCIITFNIDYCYMYVLLLHTPSYVWPEFNKLLSIVYCLHNNKIVCTQGLHDWTYFNFILKMHLFDKTKLILKRHNQVKIIKQSDGGHILN